MKPLIADTVILNGQIVTVNAKDEIKQALAIRDNKILDVGTNHEIMEYVGENTSIISVKGKTVTPGFIDAHVHLCMLSMMTSVVIDVRYPDVKSIAQIREIIKEAVKTKKPGEWVVLFGYDDTKVEEKRHPNKEDLNDICPDNPVQLGRFCGHMGVYNDYALNLLGIDGLGKYLPGEVELNEDGTPTGLLKETAHMESNAKIDFSEEEMLNGYELASNYLMENGVTGIHDAGYYERITTKVEQDACLMGKMKARVNMMRFSVFGKEPNKSFNQLFHDTGVHTGLGNEHFKIGPSKFMLDGATTGPTAAMFDDYCHDPGNKGVLIYDQDELNEVILKAHKAGNQITAHATGDKAVTMMLNAYENALKLYPRENHRHRIEHSSLTNDDIIRRMKEMGVIPIANPNFIKTAGLNFDKWYGPRCDYLFPLKRYVDNGIICCLGTDSPVVPVNPMFSIYEAVTRRDVQNDYICAPDQRIGILDAIRMATYNPAYTSFEEDIKGSLEPGKLADIVILDRDIINCDPEELLEAKVEYTIVDGIIEYKAN